MQYTAEDKTGVQEHMDRKTFLQNAGRLAMLLVLGGLGGFLYRRNTCQAAELEPDQRRHACAACRQLSACERSDAVNYRNATKFSE